MKKTILMSALFIVLLSFFLLAKQIHAQPYGKGMYGSEVPYGSMTSLSIATNENINIPITPTNGGTLATGLSSINIISTDVVGYKLYIRALNSTDMNNLGSLIPASANASPAPLDINTWGYNTDETTDFTGITLSDVLIRSSNVPVSAGEATEVTYGINIDLSKPAGNYTTNIVYTAVPQTD